MKAAQAIFWKKPYSDHALLGAIESAFGKEGHSDLDIADAARQVAALSPREREVS